MAKLRKPIPAETKRRLKIESGFRCAVPHCHQAVALEFHHINEDPSDNSIENLLVLCAVHHSQTVTGEIDTKACREIKARISVQALAFDPQEIAHQLAVYLQAPKHLPDPIGNQTNSLQELAAAVESEFGTRVEVMLHFKNRLIVWVHLPVQEFSEAKNLALAIACLVSGREGDEQIEVGPSDTHLLIHGYIGAGIGAVRFRFECKALEDLARKKGFDPAFWRSVFVVIGKEENSIGQHFLVVPFPDFERRAR